MLVLLGGLAQSSIADKGPRAKAHAIFTNLFPGLKARASTLTPFVSFVRASFA